MFSCTEGKDDRIQRMVSVIDPLLVESCSQLIRNGSPKGLDLRIIESKVIALSQFIEALKSRCYQFIPLIIESPISLQLRGNSTAYREQSF